MSRFDLAEAWRAAPAAGQQIATAVLEVHVQSAERNENNVLQVRRPVLTPCLLPGVPQSQGYTAVNTAAPQVAVLANAACLRSAAAA